MSIEPRQKKNLARVPITGNSRKAAQMKKTADDGNEHSRKKTKKKTERVERK